MDLLKKYLKLQKEIHEYFGYVEDWRVIPLADETDSEWHLNQAADGSGSVFYGPKLDQDIIESGDCFEVVVYTQRFLPKYVYRGEDYTMIAVDTQTDGNKLLMVFSNALEVTDV